MRESACGPSEARSRRASTSRFFRASGDERPKPPFHVDISLVLQRPVRLLNRIGVDLQFAGKFADGGQGLIRFQNSNRNAAADFVDDLAIHRPGILRIYVD